MGNKNDVLGSVAIIRYKGNYSPEYFTDFESIDQKSKEKIFLTFYDVNAMKYSKKINELCDSTSCKKIPESQLVKKLKNLLTKNASKTRINQ